MAILELDRLTRHFEIPPGFVVRAFRCQPSNYINAVERLSLTVDENEVLRIVGGPSMHQVACHKLEVMPDG
ncbi:MAG: hypothetical protein GY952_21030 [Rhodobacteraceae bacterium]|nr:hypothetical protein [Paracoccaceae bacterium]